MTSTTTSTASVTPAEEDFPLIISVDDHILEPRDLWQWCSSYAAHSRLGRLSRSV